MIYIKILSGRNKRFTKTTITKENMQDDNKTITAKDWILKLANGINPLNGSALPDDDIVNNVHISRCLFYVSDLLDTIPDNSKKKSKKYDLDFYIKPEDLGKVVIVDSTGISNLVREINKLIPDNMRPLHLNKIVNWLITNGYLEEVEDSNFGKKKTPTVSGSSIGISAESRQGTNGQYWAVLYNSNAQRFILNNLYAIIGA